MELKYKHVGTLNFSVQSTPNYLFTIHKFINLYAVFSLRITTSFEFSECILLNWITHIMDRTIFDPKLPEVKSGLWNNKSSKKKDNTKNFYKLLSFIGLS